MPKGIYVRTKEIIRKISEAKLGKKNPNWAGKDVGYSGIHRRIKLKKPKPKFCEDCKEEKKLELTSISEKYLSDISDWKWLCRRCHMQEDGRMENRNEGGLFINK